jgi:predicted Zn finger-like uncharacterized protein
MNIRCPHCKTVFRIDPDRIPSSGVRARCARCTGTFRIEAQAARPPAATGAVAMPGRAPDEGAANSREQPPAEAPGAARGNEAADSAQPGGAAAAASQAIRGTRPDAADRSPEPAAVAGGPGGGGAGGSVGGRDQTPADGEAAPAGTAEVRPAAFPLGTAAPARSRKASFASRDPEVRAQRLARALVSDIVAYHPERLEKTLAGGSIRLEFRDEIMKSWDEYVAQVGIERAKATPYFRDALNEILARGRKVF